MNLNKNYYKTLDIKGDSTEREVKKAYYRLSYIHHPDKNGDPEIFSEITEAYDVLCSNLRQEYDKKSKFGNSYDEYTELLNVDFNINYDSLKVNLDKFKRDEILDVLIRVNDDFDGSVEYDRWVLCKKCNGNGKDNSSKILIKDNDGNVVKVFDADDGCDFCEGSGKDYANNICYFCKGQGKVGIENCKTCDGEQRIMGKQRVKGIKLVDGETKVEAMGHVSKTEIGRVGHLIIIKENG